MEREDVTQATIFYPHMYNDILTATSGTVTTGLVPMKSHLRLDGEFSWCWYSLSGWELLL